VDDLETSLRFTKVTRRATLALSADTTLIFPSVRAAGCWRGFSFGRNPRHREEPGRDLLFTEHLPVMQEIADSNPVALPPAQ